MRKGDKGAALLDYVILVTIIAVACVQALGGVRSAILKTFCQDLNPGVDASTGLVIFAYTEFQPERAGFCYRRTLEDDLVVWEAYW